MLPLVVQEPASTWAKLPRISTCMELQCVALQGPTATFCKCWIWCNRWRDHVCNPGGVGKCLQNLLLARQAVGSCYRLAGFLCVLVGFGMQHASCLVEDLRGQSFPSNGMTHR